MANQYDAGAGTFDVTRLRTSDAAYLAGVDRPSSLPEPIAIARGPFVTGPQAGDVGAGDSWVAGLSVPAMGDVVWVVVNGNLHLRQAAASAEVDAIHLFPRGSVTNAAYFEGPELGPGTILEQTIVASGGTNPLVDMGRAPYTPQGLFLPLDPAWTAIGWEMVAVVVAGSAILSQNTARLDCLEVKLIGYPANVWGTGGLHAVSAFRGS